MKRRTTWTVTAGVVAAATAGLYIIQSDVKASTPRLSTAVVSEGAIVATVDATGTLQPLDVVEVGTQVSGTIASLGADFNSRVTKGQVVARLDPALLQSQVNQAEATVNRLTADLGRARAEAADANVKLERANQLSEKQLIARSDLDAARSTADMANAAVASAQAQIVQAQAALDQSRVNLSHTVITAPVDGIVLSRNVEVGQTVAAGLQTPTLFVIARDLGSMELRASVDEADVGKLRQGQSVSFTVDAYGEERFHGAVRDIRLQPTVAQNVVSYTTVIDVKNADGRLKPGMTATVSIEVDRADDVLKVPTAALRFSPTPEVLDAFASSRTSGATRAADRLKPAPTSDARDTRWSARSSTTGPDAASRPTASATAGRRNAQRVWIVRDGQLTPVRVAVGLSDGTAVAVTSPDLAPGAEVVTGVIAQDSPRAAPSSGSPLMPSFPRRGGTRRQ